VRALTARVVGSVTVSLNLKTETERVVDVLQRAGVDFAICGGIAVTIHGAPRFTRDIDLLIRAEDESRAVVAVALAGFDLPADPMVFDASGPLERRILRVSKAEGSDLLTLDLIVASPGFEDVWSTRVLVEWEGRRVPVVSVDGLIKMKRVAGRPQDLVDIENLSALTALPEE